jgi:hypothetical protein
MSVKPFLILLMVLTVQLGWGTDPPKRVKEKPRYWGAIDPNFGLGILDVEGIAVAGLQTAHGFWFGDHFSAGLGTGIDLYESDRFIPLYFEGRAYLGNRKTRFMAGFSWGAYLATSDASWENYINPFLGFTYNAFDHIAFSLSLGLIYKQYDVRREPVRLPNGTVDNIAGTRRVTGEFVVVRFGCVF